MRPHQRSCQGFHFWHSRIPRGKHITALRDLYKILLQSRPSFRLKEGIQDAPILGRGGVDKIGNDGKGKVSRKIRRRHYGKRKGGTSVGYLLDRGPVLFESLEVGLYALAECKPYPIEKALFLLAYKGCGTKRCFPFTSQGISTREEPCLPAAHRWFPTALLSRSSGQRRPCHRCPSLLRLALAVG